MKKIILTLNLNDTNLTAEQLLTAVNKMVTVTNNQVINDDLLITATPKVRTRALKYSPELAEMIRTDYTAYLNGTRDKFILAQEAQHHGLSVTTIKKILGDLRKPNQKYQANYQKLDNFKVKKAPKFDKEATVEKTPFTKFEKAAKTKTDSTTTKATKFAKYQEVMATKHAE